MEASGENYDFDNHHHENHGGSSFLSYSDTLVVTTMALDVFYFFDFYLKVGYYLLIIPFRFGNRDGIFYIHTNRIQMSLSSSIFSIVLIQSIFDLRVYIEKGLMKSPERTFEYSYAVLLVVFAFVWFNTFWLNRERFQILLDYCQRKGTVRCPKLRWMLALKVVIILCEVKFFYEIILECYQHGIQGILQYYGGIGRYNLYFHVNDEPIPEDDMDPGTFVFSVIYYLIFIQYRQIEHFMELLAIIAAMAVYYEAETFIHIIHTMDISVTESVSQVFDVFSKFLSLLDSINNITGTPILVYVIGMIPTMIWCIFGIFDPKQRDIFIFFAYKILASSSQLLLAASANSKIHDFGKWILKTHTKVCKKRLQNHNLETAEQHDPHQNFRWEVMKSLEFIHREICTNQIGLQGGHFFTISHGFIGTAFSIVVTYAVVMLQFQVEKHQRIPSEPMNDCGFRNVSTTTTTL